MIDERWVGWLLVVLAACGVREPDWVEDCDCGADQVCTWAGPAECQDIPEACSAALAGTCDLQLLDDACRAALCDLPLGDSGEIAGTNSTDVECWTTDDTPTQRWIDCDASMTF
jgi:hypothetical protein